jgi:hypothetical protein
VFVVDICKTEQNPCKNGATCTGSYEEDIIYTCQCSTGWNGKNCTNCDSNACLNGGTCIESTGTCSCKDGFTGTNCQNSNFLFVFLMDFFIGLKFLIVNIANLNCQTNKCLNNGTCIESTGLCTCKNGFIGLICETSNFNSF